jgi:hypothetical protein
MDMSAYLDQDVFDPRKIAKALLTSRDDVAHTAGLRPSSIRNPGQVRNVETQQRLCDLMKVLVKVGPRLGSLLIAYAWVRATPLPGFGGSTAMSLIQEGRAADVLNYIDVAPPEIFS